MPKDSFYREWQINPYIKSPKRTFPNLFWCPICNKDSVFVLKKAESVEVKCGKCKVSEILQIKASLEDIDYYNQFIDLVHQEGPHVKDRSIDRSVVNCYKPKVTIKNGIEGKTSNEAIVRFLAAQLLKLPLAYGEERSPRMLRTRTIDFFMLQNKPLRNLSFEDFQRILKSNFREIDGYWYLPYQRRLID